MKHLPILSFWFLGIVWGSNFIYMKMASEYISASQIVLFRVLFGFIPVVIYSYFNGILKKTHLKHARHYFVMSLLATVVYYYGFVKGASLLLSGIAGALSGAIPIFAFITAMIFLKQEKISLLKIIGVLVGFIGVVIIANPFSGDLSSTNIEGLIYMVGGSLSVGVSFIYAKKYVTSLNIPAAALTTYQLGLGLIILLIIVSFDDINNIWSDVHASIGLVLGLGLLGTGIAYIAYYYIINKLGAVNASAVTYIPPIVALTIGVVLVGEDIKLIDYFATVLVFIGVFLINKK